MTGQQLLCLLWTLWLVVALLAIGRRAGVVLALAVGALSLGLVLADVMSWRAFLLAGLSLATLAAALRAYGQLRHPSPPTRPEAPASVRRESLRPVAAWVERWPMQVISASVSLAGLIWLLILRPPVPWVYAADIPIMIGTVAALVAAEYRFWRLYDNVSRRLAVTAQQLEAERRQRQESDAQNVKAERRFRLAQADLSKREDALRQTRTDLQQTRDELGQAWSSLARAEQELRRAQAEFPEVGDESSRARGDGGSGAKTPPSERDDSAVWYRRDKGAKPGELISADSVRVELISICWLTVRQEASASEPGGRDAIILQRRTEKISPKPGETAGQVIGRAEARLRHVVEAAAANYAAQAIADPAWTVVSGCWVTKADSFTAAASTVANLKTDVHNVLLNKPAELIGSGLGLPKPVGLAIAGIADQVKLPIDPSLDAMTRVIQIGGIVVGAISANPVLVSACFKAIAHEAFVQCLADGIEKILNGHELSAAEQQPTATRLEAAAPPSMKPTAAEIAAELSKPPRPGWPEIEPGGPQIGRGFSPIG